MMMSHHSLSPHSRKSKSFKARRIFLFSALLGVVLWLSYQIKHSYIVKREYYRITEAKDDHGHTQVYLGRKFHPGAYGGSWEDDTSGLKEDSNNDDSQIQTEERDHESFDEDEGSREGTESKEDTETQKLDLVLTENNVDDSHTNDDDSGFKESEAEKLGETSASISENVEEMQEGASDLSNQGSDINNDVENTEENGVDGTSGKSEDGSEVAKEDVLGNLDDTNGKSEDGSVVTNEDVSEKQDENPESIASLESSEHTKDKKKGTVSIAEEMEHNAQEMEQNNHEETHLSSVKEDDASHEQTETETGISDSHNENNELESQVNQSDGRTQNKQSKQEETHPSKEKEDDVSGEKVGTETDSHNENIESDNQVSQSDDTTRSEQSKGSRSEGEKISDSQDQNDVVEATGSAGTESGEGIVGGSTNEEKLSDSSLSNGQHENNTKMEDKSSRKEEIKSKGHDESTDSKINSESSNSTGYVKSHTEMLINRENLTEDVVMDTEGNHYPKSEESSTSTTEATQSKPGTQESENSQEIAENNLLMVTHNVTSKTEVVDSQEGGGSETKDAEDAHSDGADLGSKSSEEEGSEQVHPSFSAEVGTEQVNSSIDEEVGSEQVHPSNEDAHQEGRGEDEVSSSSSGSQAISSNETSIEPRKEEF